MTDDTTQAKLVKLLTQTREAHHQAYIETDGVHADWPIWYAEYLHKDLSQLLNANFSVSELVYLLVGLDKGVQQQAPVQTGVYTMPNRLLADIYDCHSC